MADPTLPMFVCPFCGGATPDQPRCAHCHGPLDPLSRQATQNAMGPWFVRDDQQPFRPGCSYETILAMVARGKISGDTILRGPSTSQFWYPAKRVPGVANHLGVCHSCQAIVSNESECPRCGAVFHGDPDRQYLGLMPIRAIPGTGAEPAPRVAPPEPPVTPIPSVTQAAASPVAQRPMDRRLETEIAALRRRTNTLAAVSIACALLALGAIWLLVSGASAGTSANSSVGAGGDARRAASDDVPTQPSEDGGAKAERPMESKPPALASESSKPPVKAEAVPAPVSNPPGDQPAAERPKSEPAPKTGPDLMADALARLAPVRWP